MDLIKEYREMAAGGQSFRGLSVLQHKHSIRTLAHAVGAKTMLDYGCGAGDAYSSPHKLHHFLGIRRADVTLYDPAFPKHNVVPTGQYDLVVCSDVLEHVPEDMVDGFVANLFARAKKGVWASVCCRPAKKSFNDGTNLHVTIKGFQWWHDTFAEHATGDASFVLVETP